MVEDSSPYASYLRFEIIVMLAVGHLDKRVDQICLPGLLLHKPYLVKTLPTDATTQVGMELCKQVSQ